MGKGFRKSERIYAFFLDLYPKSYRQEFREEMKYVFSQSLKETYKKDGDEGISTFWGRIFLDIARSLFKEHLENREGGDSLMAKSNNFITKNKNIVRVAVIVGLVLLVPLFGNMFMAGWSWGVADFVIMGGLLFATGLAADYARRKIKNPMHRYLVIAIIILALFLLWVELATDGVSRQIGVLF